MHALKHLGESSSGNKTETLQEGVEKRQLESVEYEDFYVDMFSVCSYAACGDKLC